MKNASNNKTIFIFQIIYVNTILMAIIMGSVHLLLTWVNFLNETNTPSIGAYMTIGLLAMCITTPLIFKIDKNVKEHWEKIKKSD